MKKAMQILTFLLVAVTSVFLTVASANDTVRYATDGYGMSGTIVLASENGYLKDEGIDPIIQTYAYGVDTIDAVLAGQADFGVVIGFPLLTRFVAEKLIVPAVIGEFVPGWHKLYTTTELKNADKFKGKSFGVATGTAQEFVTRNYLTKIGLEVETDVKLVDFGDLFGIVGAMKSGRIDAAWIWGEGVNTIKEDSKFAFVTDDSVVSDGATALLVTSKEFASSNHELIVKTLRALHKSTADITSDADGAAVIIANKVGADSALVKRAIDQARYRVDLASGSVSAMRSKYEFLLNAGKIEAYDLAAQFDSTALAKAIPSAEIDAFLK